MKTEINQAIFKKSNFNFGEIYLFREMTKSLNNYLPAIYIHETHGRKGWVKFHSTLKNDTRQKEISDLLIVCVNKPTKEIKISFLQVKYHRTNTTPFLKFHGDYLQLELLSQRPSIDANNFFRFPQNILNFSNYKSLTTFGVFFHDRNGEIDMLYTTTDLLITTNINGLKGPIQFLGNPQCPKANCFTSNINEMISTCNIDLFENGLINFQIGAPISQNNLISDYFSKLFKQIISNEKKTENLNLLKSILDDFINNKDIPENLDPDTEGNPSMLIIQTNIEQIGNI
jgi:hypothetical protein